LPDQVSIVFIQINCESPLWQAGRQGSGTVIFRFADRRLWRLDDRSPKPAQGAALVSTYDFIEF